MSAHKKNLHVKKLDPSWLMLDPYLRWIYAGYICCRSFTVSLSSLQLWILIVDKLVTMP